jgi:alkylated DNA nucleotide flippase Atl1
MDVEAEMRTIPAGSTLTIADIRAAMAAKYGGNTACPLVSGIFWRLCAEAAEEDRATGGDDICPYWRVVKEGGRMNEKLPGGIEAHAERLASEGVKVDRTKNGAPFVA